MSRQAPIKADDYFNSPHELTKADIERVIAFGKSKGRKIWDPQSILEQMGDVGYKRSGRVMLKKHRHLRQRIAYLLKLLEEDGVLIRRPEPQSRRMIGDVAYESKDAV